MDDNFLTVSKPVFFFSLYIFLSLSQLAVCCQCCQTQVIANRKINLLSLNPYFPYFCLNYISLFSHLCIHIFQPSAVRWQATQTHCFFLVKRQTENKDLETNGKVETNNDFLLVSKLRFYICL